MEKFGKKLILNIVSQEWISEGKIKYVQVTRLWKLLKLCSDFKS